jgi:hypothetical protein
MRDTADSLPVEDASRGIARYCPDKCGAAFGGSSVQGVQMAKQTVTTLVDDIDGSAATETVTFGLDGATYEIDLNEAHAADLREVLAPFLSVARKATGAGSRTRSTRPRPRPPAPARAPTSTPRPCVPGPEEHGVAVSPRGRIRATC